MDQHCIKEIAQEHDGEVYNFPIGVLAENVATDDSRQFISKSELADLKAKPGTTSPVNNNTVTFTQATNRTNIASGEKLSTIVGKVSKWLADLGTAAFQGVSNTLGTTSAGYVLDARAGKELNDKLGGMRFYEDASGKYVVGADSVPKKLGSVPIDKTYSVTAPTQEARITDNFTLSVANIDAINVHASVPMSHAATMIFYGSKNDTGYVNKQFYSYDFGHESSVPEDDKYSSDHVIDVSQYDSILINLGCYGRNNAGFTQSGTATITLAGG